MTEQPFLLLDPRSGSRDLKPFLQALGARVDDSTQIDADFAFCGYGRDGLMPIGGEYKLTVTQDIFSSLTDGRLTGTQLPRMLDSYSMRYLLIEGPTRADYDGNLQYMTLSGDWRAPTGRSWTAHEYWSRLGSVAEFWSEPNVPGRTEVKETYDKRQSAQWIISRWRYWQKHYTEHESYRQIDESRAKGGKRAKSQSGQISFLATSDLPIVQRMGREIDGVGSGYSGYLAQHFATPAEMILGSRELAEATRSLSAEIFADNWRRVQFMQKFRKKEGYRAIHFSDETVDKIRVQLWGENSGK